MARALPLRRYADPAVLEAEVEGAFRGDWLMVGRASEVARAGDYLAIDVVGEPIVVVRGGDGVLRAFSRLCTHRGFPLVDEGVGHLDRFTCGYHLWSFRPDGSLIGAPLSRDVAGFDADCLGLPTVRLEEWQGFVFVCLDPDVEPLGPRLAGVAEALVPHGLTDMVATVLTDEVWDSNWKLGVENASESYHHPGSHPDSVGPYAPPVGSWVEPGTEHWSVHRTRIVDRDGVSGDLDRLIPLPAVEIDAFRCYTIFPSTVILTWRASCTWLTFLPLTPDRTRVRTGLLHPPAILDHPRWPGVADDLVVRTNAVNHEDRDALARLQRATSARLAAPGPLVAQEGVLAELYRYLDRRTRAATPV